jgi:hypothetical protein
VDIHPLRHLDHHKVARQRANQSLWGIAMFVRALVFGVALAIAAGALPSSDARAASWLEKNFWLSGPRYDGVMPACEAGLEVVASRFADKESQYWESRLAIDGFDRVREIAYRPTAANAIPRRYCSAVAYIAGHRHSVYYSIGEDTGFIGASWGVEWCVVGFDRNWAYNPRCKMARP